MVRDSPLFSLGLLNNESSPFLLARSKETKQAGCGGAEAEAKFPTAVAIDEIGNKPYSKANLTLVSDLRPAIFCPSVPQPQQAIAYPVSWLW